MTKKITIVYVLNYNTSLMSDKEKSRFEILSTLTPTTGCELDKHVVYTTSQETLFERLNEIPNIDFIVHFGLGNGLLFNETSVRSMYGAEVWTNDDTPTNLFYDSKLVFTESFRETLYTKIRAVDEKKSLPDGIKLAKTKEDLQYIVDRCLKEPFGFDTETNFLNPFIKSPEPILVCFSIAWLSDENEGWCIPVNEKHRIEAGCEYSKEEIDDAMNSIFFETTQPIYIHNAAYDLLVLYELFKGKQPKNFAGCTMLLLNLYHKAEKSAALGNNTELIGLPAWKEPIKTYLESVSVKKKSAVTYADIPIDLIAPYASLDAIAVVRLVNFLKKNLDMTSWKFYYNVPHRVLLCSNDLCAAGYEISQDRFYHTKFELEREIASTFRTARGYVSAHVTDKFNIASGQQLADLLFDKLGLPVVKKTEKGDRATSQKVLDDLMLFHPFIFYLSKIKKLQKLYSSYCLGYYNVLDSGSRHYKRVGKTKWIFNAEYGQVNRTARLSSKNKMGHKGTSKKGGNVLTLPAAGSMVKHFFIPRPVVEAENDLYEHILEVLKDQCEEKYNDFEKAINYDVNTSIKPGTKKKKDDL